MSAAPTPSVTRGVALMILAVFLFTAMDATAKGLIQRYPAPQVIWVRFAGQLVLAGGTEFARFPAQNGVFAQATPCFHLRVTLGAAAQ